MLPLNLYQRLKQSLRYKYSKDYNDQNNFIAELPYNLRVETALYIHENNYNSIAFLRERTDSFIAWICPLMKPTFIAQDEHLYAETQDIDAIYFLKSGNCGFVLGNKYMQAEYIDVTQGSTFVTADIYGAVLMLDDETIQKNVSFGNQIFQNWINFKGRLKRQYNAMAVTNSELLVLDIVLDGCDGERAAKGAGP